MSGKKTSNFHKRSLLVKKFAFMFAPIILLTTNYNIKPTSAFFNCFNPNMFKMGKGPGQVPLGYGHVGERANWYPQQQQVVGYSPYAMSSYSPMKMLFQPKWKSGLFGGQKGGWNNWKMGGPGGYYRPNYANNYVPMPIASTGSGYQFSEQLNVAPFSLPSPISPYSSSADVTSGWSAPVSGYNSQPIQQSPLNNYEQGVYAPQAPLIQPPKNQVDPYSIKGGNTAQLGKLTTTKNSLLIADGGYNAHDSYLMGNLKNQTFGYSYPPNWSTGQFVDSPGRIAQQLLKYNLRKLRLQEQNRSAPLLKANSGNSKFTILDEPRFVGFGTVEELNNKEARLSCSFNEAVDQTNLPLWVKFSGPYNTSQVLNGKTLPPFNCANSLCRTQEIESTKDFRFKFDNGPATSTLIITDPRLSDYGIYRCSALTKTINNKPLETLYQVVRFGSLK